MSDRNPSSNDDSSSLRVPRTRPNPTEGSLQLDLFGNPPTPTRRFRESARPERLGSAPQKPQLAAPRPADAIRPDLAARPHRLVTPASPMDEPDFPPLPPAEPLKRSFREPVLRETFREPVTEPVREPPRETYRPPVREPGAEPAPPPPPPPEPKTADAGPHGPFFPGLTRGWLAGFAAAAVLAIGLGIYFAWDAALKAAPPAAPAPVSGAESVEPIEPVEAPAPAGDLPAVEPVGDIAPVVSAEPIPAAAPEAVAAPVQDAAEPEEADAEERTPLPAWSKSGVWKAEQVGGKMVFVFEKPVFVSADYLSKEGLAAVRELARRLARLDKAASIEIVGHTDDERITNPNAKFTSNEALAKARAQRVEEHFVSLLSGRKALAVSSRAGAVGEAPYPNDSDANRKRNRTVSIFVSPVAP
jgi:outer membrane protein OmpA-like peptidoglycan-associated protein